MSDRVGADGSLEVACEAAHYVLEQQGSALEAAVAGYFRAVADLPGVLLSPASLLVGRNASTIRVFDGRVRQPGLGSKRPRGFLPEESVPDVARVAAPRAAQVLLVALAYDAKLRLSLVLHPTLHDAEAGASRRLRLLRRVQALGARAFREPAFVGAIVAQCGPAHGGLVGALDFEVSDTLDDPVSLPATLRPQNHARSGQEQWDTYGAPWSLSEAFGEASKGSSKLEQHYLMTVDGGGQMVCLEYAEEREGVAIDELELIAPRLAVPVLRGVPRMTPGAALPWVAHGAISCDATSLAVNVSCRVGKEIVALYRDAESRRVRMNPLG